MDDTYSSCGAVRMPEIYWMAERVPTVRVRAASSMETGRLFVVATPIGNLEDMGARAVRVLGAVSVIAAEDTRHSRKLLDRFGIATPLTSYHDHNEAEKADHLLDALRGGRDVALITDAGTPCIADPGYRIVRAARDAGIAVEAVPGPNAAIAALSVSGLPTDRFAFHGFFPRKKKDADAAVDRARAFGGTHVFYEAPNRVGDTLAMLANAAPDAEVCVARELTKVHEEVLRGAPAELAKRFEDGPPKGECVVLVHFAENAGAPADYSDDEIRAAVEDAMSTQSLSRRDAVREVA
ncbi:MAG: 16S rRNA (cytidine(1402)-2'-O)-methyltransferase, partial [Candidatus Hydrogenedentes bacterium]|nr:16S rRNA (cytidine(1402)-2'-O)-methyltransferase [Candidatus Hydrogenedentota bacterium]